MGSRMEREEVAFSTEPLRPMRVPRWEKRVEEAGRATERRE